MSNAFRFYLAFWFTLFGAALVVVYIGWKYVDFHQEIAQSHSAQLIEFSRRSQSRIEANPKEFNLKRSGDNIELGNRKMMVVSHYSQLQAQMAYLPTDENQYTGAQVNVVFGNLNGLFSLADFALIYPFEANGERYYASFVFNDEVNDPLLQMQLAQSLQPVVFISAFVIGLLFFGQAIYTYRMDRNLSKLADWAQDLSISKKPTTPPQMLEKGLNPLATMVNNSLNTFNNLLEKEHSFARFTSHELRTQVAILSANMEILDAIMADLKPSERKVLYRMEQVVSDMKYQTEALLWVSKEAEQELEYSECHLFPMVRKSVSDNQYLLEHKAVSIDVIGKDRVVSSHPVLLQIAINNLVRNAAQNTFQGKIVINIDDHHLAILNQDLVEDSNTSNPDGFGIGLVMVEKICKRLNMDYQVEILSNGRWVKLFI